MILVATCWSRWSRSFPTSASAASSSRRSTRATSSGCRRRTRASRSPSREELLQQTNKIIKQFPEVHHTFGKIGRAETSTDPAPLSMIETTIMLKPPDEWPQREIHRFLQRLAAAARPCTMRCAASGRRASRHGHLENWIGRSTTQSDFPGLTNAGMEGPIKIRLDMLTTGIRAPGGHQGRRARTCSGCRRSPRRSPRSSRPCPERSRHTRTSRSAATTSTSRSTASRPPGTA